MELAANEKQLYYFIFLKSFLLWRPDVGNRRAPEGALRAHPNQWRRVYLIIIYGQKK